MFKININKKDYWNCLILIMSCYKLIFGKCDDKRYDHPKREQILLQNF